MRDSFPIIQKPISLWLSLLMHSELIPYQLTHTH